MGYSQTRRSRRHTRKTLRKMGSSKSEVRNAMRIGRKWTGKNRKKAHGKPNN